jgi:ElaB/YqjD/DUF883 family membrane-anchored ribosome-binding protein
VNDEFMNRGENIMAVELLEKSATVEDVLREVSKMKSMVADAVEDGVQSALRAIKQGRDAAEDAIHDAKHAVRQNPFQAMGVVFGAGVMIGGLVTWIGSRRR